MNKWDERFMTLAETVAEWSSCYQANRHVGAVIVKDKRILTTGYNGAPAGVTSCAERGVCLRREKNIPSGTNDHHISYSKKVDSDSSLGQYEPLIGFTPSISESEYCIKEVTAIEKKITDPILISVINNLKSTGGLFLTPKKFDKSILATLPNVDETYITSFCEQLTMMYDLFGINQFNSFRVQLRNIVTNGCKVEAIILEQNKPTTISVNIGKYKGQTSLLGKRVGDKFKLSNIPLTYQIQRISR